MAITINFLGDINLGCLFENYRGVVVKQIELGINPLANVKQLLYNADLNIANLECVLSNVSDKKPPLCDILRAPESYAKILKENRVDVVCLANNHSFDHGETAFIRMKAALKENNISFFGEARNAIQCEPVILNVNNQVVGLLGFYFEETLCSSFYGQLVAHIKKQCIVSKNRCNSLILSLHWGHEYTSGPVSWQVELAKELIDGHGVDVIYGHHPHRLHGYALYNNKLFIPSLGNFIFDDYVKKNRITSIIKATIEETGHISNVEQTPLYINKKFQPTISKRLSQYIDYINNQTVKSLSLSKYHLLLWDRNQAKVSKRGHLVNRIKIRILFILRFYIFLPYLFRLLNNRDGLRR